MTKAWAMNYNNLKPITETQKKHHAQQSARWIFVHDKTGNATCTRCGKEINVGHTKHKSELVCPNCTNKLIVQHEWRMSQKIEVINWMVVPKVINDHTLCLRYVLAYQSANKPMYVTEKARMFIDEKRVEPEYYCLGVNGWEKGKSPYFRRDCMITPNRFFCMYADIYPRRFHEEIDKLDCFKHYSSRIEYDPTRMPSQMIYHIHSAKLNEKLTKVGLDCIVKEHLDYFLGHYDRVYPMNYKATDLISMLKLDKPRFNLLREFPSRRFMFYLQSNKNVDVNKLRAVKGDVSKYEYVDSMAKTIGVSFTKLNKYLENVNYNEHRHYLLNLQTLGYNIKDTYYSLPKDFDEADERITDEYLKKFDKQGYNAKRKNNRLIKKISDGIRKLPNLKEFLDGSRGLLVYVPESSQDLEKEGREMHCCLGTYPQRVAEGKTLIFFVRKLDNPTAPFVAFEYCNGDVVQCRYERNEEVKDTEIIKFVNDFSAMLRQNRVMCA